MMMMMVVVMLLLTLGPFRTEESSNEVIFIKFLDQGLGISVKGALCFVEEESQERDLTICEVVLLWGPEIVRTEETQRGEIYGDVGKVGRAMSL